MRGFEAEMAAFARVKTILLLVLVPVSVYIGVLNLLDRLDWKTPSDGLDLIQTVNGVKVAPGDWSQVSSEISEGDLLADINGMVITTLDDYFEVLDAFAQGSEESFVADYTLKRAGSDEELTLPVRLELRPQFSASDIPLLVVALAFLGIGVFVYIRNGTAPGVFHFTLLCVVGFILLAYRFSGRGDGFDQGIYWITVGTMLLLPPLFLHFCSAFPAPTFWVRGRAYSLILVYIPGILLGIAHTFWFMGRLKLIGLPRTPEIGHVFDKVELAYFAGYLALSAVILIRSGGRAEDPIHRKQMRWISTGTLLGLVPFCLLYVLPYLLGLRITTWMEGSVLALVFVPLSFGYAIAKFRITDVDLIFNRGIAYVLASSTLLAFYISVAVLITRALQEFSPGSSFILLAASALAVAVLFAPLKDKIQVQIDRRFYKDRYGYRRSLLEFGQTLGSEIHLTRLTEKIADRIQKTLDVSAVSIFLREDGNSATFRMETGLNLDRDTQTVSVQLEEKDLIDLGYGVGSLGIDAAGSSSVRAQLFRWGIRYIEPLAVRGRIIGFLGLSRRKNGDFLSTEDLEMVGSLARYAAIAVDNALLYRSLEAKANELLQLRIYSENVVESIRLGVAVISANGEITVWNSAMEGLTGLDPAAAIGKRIQDTLPESLLSALQEIVDGPDWLVKGVRRIFKAHLRTSDDQTRLINITLSPFVSYENINTGTLLVADDITEKTHLENQVQQAEKLSSIGLFAAGLAHEVNTPLTGISSYSQMLLEETPASDPRHELLSKIERQSFRASEIINNLLNFARFSDSDFQEVNLNTLLMDTLSLLEPQLRRSQIEIKTEFDATLPKTRGNGGKLQQVFMNLFLNARDSMAEGGCLSLRTFRRRADLVVQIQDTGMGISKEDIKRIYDPFFTTKNVGEGTGLGLSISYGIIQEHSGRISVESTPGTGTTFSLYLPITRVN
ncbi:MAG: PAS domain S-box protein [Acidobacteriota bacterium]|nr:MAG: PAS domain S-box protein [Acidobacteriota bacterium]